MSKIQSDTIVFIQKGLFTDKFVKCIFEFYTNGLLYRLEDDNKHHSCIDLKRVIDEIELHPTQEYFQNLNDKPIRKLYEKYRLLFFTEDELKDVIVMAIPVKPGSSKKWMLLFPNLQISK